MERIPLFEVVMTSGEHALTNNENWYLDVARKYLDYKKGSVEEAMLTSFFEVIPAHEKTVGLAYMLANSRQGQGSIANLFEVFGTVGIKFGQLASIWELFGKKIAEDTKHLKNSAAPMSLHDIISLAEERDPSIKDKILDYEIILGSASVKTVVKIKLKDGRTGVLLLQRNGLKENISMNLDIGKRFIESLKQKNVIQNSKFLQAMIEALEEQLHDEISMKTEADKFKKAFEIISDLNTDMKKELGDWTFKVPQRIEGMPLREDMAFYEMAEGVAFEKLSAEKQKEYGHLIAQANLKSLLKYGWFDPDRHTGNFFINEKTKTIWFLDFGQFSNFSKNTNPFKWDPRLTLAHFIMALDKMDASEILHYAKLMSNSDSVLTIEQEKMILKELTETIQNLSQNKTDIKESILKVIDILMNNGVKIESNYLFGALKGLIILYGENYVQSEDFKKIMKSEITDLLIKKTPIVLQEKVAMSVRKTKVDLPQAKSTLKVLQCRALFN